MQAKQAAQYPNLRPGCHIALWVTVICLATLAVNAQTLTTLYTLNGTDGAFPESALVQGFDGNFYGATAHGGPTDSGTLFRITPAGTYTVLHYFQGPDGSGPLAS